MSHTIRVAHPVSAELVVDTLDEVVDFLVKLAGRRSEVVPRRDGRIDNPTPYTKWEPKILAMRGNLPAVFSVKDVQTKTDSHQPYSSIRYCLKRMVEKGLLTSSGKSTFSFQGQAEEK